MNPSSMTGTEELLSPVRALRNAFGDTNRPDISRKIKACVACRRRKIKCQMTDSNPPCVRCREKGVSCTVNRSLQTLLESDAVWKDAMQRKIEKLEAAVQALTGSLPTSPETFEESERDMENGESLEMASSGDTFQSELPTTSNEQTGSLKVVIDLDSSPGAFPGNYLSQTFLTQPKVPKDLISRGIITSENAQRYLDVYQNRLDHFLYRILGDRGTATLDFVKQTSPFLTAAICTVGAMHLASSDYDQCYKEFLALSGAQSFSRRSTLDDVRALCIGAFWLSDVSWPLVSIAVRIATEMQLHKSFFKLINGDREHYLRTRLYFLVYACDHHFSVAYGRPPATRECEAIRNARKFLESEFATEDDSRLVSQVLRWSICSNIYDTFSTDVDRPLSEAEIPHIRKFSIALESVRAEWVDKFASNAYVGEYPRKGVGLQYHFARLYLCSHALRGAGSEQAKARSSTINWELDEITNSAVLSAMSILRAVVLDTEIQSYLNGLPIYFDIMIAFAAVFLLRTSTQFASVVLLDTNEIQRLMSSLVSVLKDVTASMHPHHLLVSITKGIDSLVQRCGVLSKPAAETEGTLAHDASLQIVRDSPIHNFDPLVADSEVFDQYFISEYDFLMS